MKIKTSELEGAALDWAVGIALNGKPIMTEIYGVHILGRSIRREVEDGRMRPSTDWSQGGPMIESLKITVEHTGSAEGPWESTLLPMDAGWEAGKTPLIASMRAIVASELGDTVDVPDELLEEA